ncbi:MAG: hypothetical protein ACJAZO_004772 [Myxococcota bacterium]
MVVITGGSLVLGLTTVKARQMSGSASGFNTDHAMG